MHRRPTTFKGKPNRHGRKAHKMRCKRFASQHGDALRETYRQGRIGQYTGFNFILVEED